jgi:hypothetical protein
MGKDPSKVVVIQNCRYRMTAIFGPGALARSVLASPWSPYVKQNVNDFVYTMIVREVSSWKDKI